MTNIPHFAHRLAGARATLETAAASAAKVRAEAEALEVRLTDALAKHAKALAELRAGRLDESAAGARLATADADAADLRGLIAAVRPTLEEAGRACEHAAQAVRNAELALARAEQEAVMCALDERIRHIEAKLCEAVAERFRLGCEHENSPYAHTLARHWRPSEPLRRAVVEQAVPPPNQTSVPAVSQACIAQ